MAGAAGRGGQRHSNGGRAGRGRLPAAGGAVLLRLGTGLFRGGFGGGPVCGPQLPRADRPPLEDAAGRGGQLGRRAADAIHQRRLQDAPRVPDSGQARRSDLWDAGAGRAGSRSVGDGLVGGGVRTGGPSPSDAGDRDRGRRAAADGAADGPGGRSAPGGGDRVGRLGGPVASGEPGHRGRDRLEPARRAVPGRHAAGRLRDA